MIEKLYPMYSVLGRKNILFTYVDKKKGKVFRLVLGPTTFMSQNCKQKRKL